MTGRTGRTVSDETREKLSICRINFLENKNPHVKWFVVDGIKVQGSWEFKVATKLSDLGIKFSRRRLKYDNARTYTPDFYLDEYDIYIEVKGWLRDSDVVKYKKVLLEHSIDLRMLHGKHALSKFLSGDMNIFDIPKYS